MQFVPGTPPPSFLFLYRTIFLLKQCENRFHVQRASEQPFHVPAAELTSRLFKHRKIGKPFWLFYSPLSPQCFTAVIPTELNRGIFFDLSLRCSIAGNPLEPLRGTFSSTLAQKAVGSPRCLHGSVSQRISLSSVDSSLPGLHWVRIW